MSAFCRFNFTPKSPIQDLQNNRMATQDLTAFPRVELMASRHTKGRFGPLAILLRINCMRSGTENLKTQLAFLILLHDLKTFFAEVPQLK